MPPGPPLGQKGAYADVASANSTLNTLMPGRQKSWMTNTLVQPSARRPRPQDSGPPQSRQSILPAQQQPSRQKPQSEPLPESESQTRPMLPQPHQTPSTPANVLPSPAPSDEPSPAALSSYNSPISQTVPLAAMSRGHPNTASPPALQLVLTNSSMPVKQGAEPSHTTAECAVSTSPENAVLGALAQAVQSPLAMPPPDLRSGNQAGASTGAAVVVGSSPYLESRPSSIGIQEHTNKRRRVEAPSTDFSFAELAASVDRRIAQIGGQDKLTVDVEGPRFQLLREACANGDVFYVHLHSLFCLWSYDPQSLPPLLTQDLDATDRGFSIVQTVLKHNSGFSKENLMWCAAFPRESFYADDSEGVKKISNFLRGLSQYWPILLPAIFNRHYPYLVDELLGQLHCYSVSMQKILFTACRRRLGIQDGHLGTQMHNLFNLDQQQHMDEQGSFRQVVLSSDSEDIERRNLILVRGYRDIWSKAQAEEQERLDQEDQHRRQQLHQQQDELRRHQREEIRRQHHERQASIQQASQQQFQRHQLQQAQLQQAQLLFQQQQLRNSQAVVIAQQQTQTQNQPQFGQLRAQVYQGYPGQQQQINTQWVQGQMHGAAASHARRPSLNDHQQIAQPAVQYASRPQSSGAFSAAASPTVPPISYTTQSMAPQLSQPPQNLILSSNFPSSPTLPDAAQMQNSYILPQQQQQQLTQGQNRRPFRPWSASPPSPAIAQSPQMSVMRTAAPSVSPYMDGQQTWSQPQPSAAVQSQTMQQAHIRQQHMVQQQLRQQLGQQQARQLHMGQQVAHQVQPNRRLVPPPGHVIDRSEHPHSHQEKKSLLMSLHQIRARSPDRTRRDGHTDERYYQYVHSLAVQPFLLIFYHEVAFEVSPEQISRLCKQRTLPQLSGGTQKQAQTSFTVREYGDGSLRFRVRCCRVRPEETPIREAEWVTKDMSWPEHIFVQVNGQKLTIRRGTHNGKDMPIELTDFILSGTNTIKIALPRAGASAADNGGKSFFLAIEMIEIASHDTLMRNIKTQNRAGREETLDKIRTRVNAAPDEDDEIAVIDRSGSTTRELSISLTDPFSAKIFRTPARGGTCTHLECFDLETWLTTRPTKQQIKCGHRDVCTCPKRWEPTEPDKWKCPICFEDARPSSLRIDSFLDDVRKQLEERNQLDIKSILVVADGTWRSIDEPDNDDDDDDDNDDESDGDGGGGGPASAARRSLSALRKSAGPNNNATPVERGRASIEVIELD